MKKHQKEKRDNFQSHNERQQILFDHIYYLIL